MSKLQKRKPSNLSLPLLQIGDTYLDHEGRVWKILKLRKKDLRISQADDDNYYRDIEPQELSKYIKMEKSLEEYQRETLQELSSGLVSFDQENQGSTSTALALSGTQDQALAVKRKLEDTTRKLAIMEAIVHRERNKLNHIRQQFAEKLEAITRVVDIMELYLGVHEEIVQIAEGEPAALEDPLCFRQLVLHMDEEVADAENGGLDFTKIPVFDKWLRVNYARVIPENRGVVIIRPRRHKMDYRLGDDPFDQFADAEMNKSNFLTYILIRNGENLYRISTGKIRIYPHLFPSPAEMQKLQTEDGWRDKEKNEAIMLAYKRNVLMLQGLLDRTRVFHPFKEGIHLLKPDTYGSHVRFIYDGDGLTDGRPAFKDWLKTLNSSLKRGDRVYFAGYPYGMFGDKDDREHKYRFPIPGWDKDRPPSGVYNIIRVEEAVHWRTAEKSLVCHFNPKDKIYRRNYWREPTERKMSIPFRLFPEEDCFFVNYEDIKIEDIDYYLNDRVNRQYYIEMVPVLKGIKTMLIEEKKWEEGFLALLKSRIKKADDNTISKAVLWWKLKVIQKRPLRKDDSKALRMIQQEVQRRLK